jgi:hypothetical protein
MGVILKWMLPLILALWAGCSLNAPMAGSGTDIGKPPFPRTKSILPLAINNSWIFSYTEYNSLGRKLIPNDINLHLSITGEYGLTLDNTLVPMNTTNYNDVFSAYAYKFEWEAPDSGYLVVYHDLYPLPKRGLYIIGEYAGGVMRLYPSEKLWLAYPADSGKTWEYNLDSAGDSSKTSTMELLSTHERFYFPNTGSMAALSFCDCYLYKKTNGNSVSYYYYNQNIGQLGYLEYVNGTLRVTYLLKSYNVRS